MPKIFAPLPTFEEIKPRLQERVQEGMKRNHLDSGADDFPPIVITHMSAHGSKALNYVEMYLDAPPDNSAARSQVRGMMLGAYRGAIKRNQELGLADEFKSPEHLDAAVRVAREFLAAQDNKGRRFAHTHLTEAGGEGVKRALQLIAEDDKKHTKYTGADPSLVKPYVTKAGKEIDPDTLVRYFTDDIAKGVFEEAFRALQIPEKEWTAAQDPARDWAKKRPRRRVNPDDDGMNDPPRSRAG